jgi:predicted metal-dependent hydrolase
MFTVDVRRTRRRRSMAMVVHADGRVEVRAPHWVSRDVVDRFIDERRVWAEQKRAEHEARPRTQPRRWTAGEVFYIDGAPHTLHLSAGPRHKAVRSPGRLDLTLPRPNSPEAVRKAVLAFYKTESLAMFSPRLRAWAQHMSEDQPLPTLEISFARQRWGSCLSRARRVRLSARLLTVPPQIQDYVLVHELAHLKYMSHGPRFWGRVETFFPDRRQAENALKIYQNLWCLEP